MKTTVKHSPGPWTADRRQITDAGKAVIASTFSGACYSLEQCDANDRLIAAAPELLGALVDLLKFMDPCEMDDDVPAVINARAAIAKAAGVTA